MNEVVYNEVDAAPQPKPTFRTSEEIDKICAAMAKVYADMDQPKMDRENPHFKSKYASAAAVDAVVRPTCAKHGVFVIQTIRDDRTLDCWVVTTRTFESSGQYFETDTPYIMPSSGASASARTRKQPQEEGQEGPKAVVKIEAKFPSTCALCKAKIHKSTPEKKVEIAYRPKTKSAAHWECWQLYLKSKDAEVQEEPAPPEEDAQVEPADEEDMDSENIEGEREQVEREQRDEEADEILGHAVADIKEALQQIDDLDDLARLRDAEKAGKDRKTVNNEINKRMAALSDDLPF